MSFIEELMKSQGTDALGITYEKPKAHDNIDNLMSSNISPEIEKVIQTAIMGGIGGPAGSLKGLTQLIKNKGGKETFKKVSNIFNEAKTPKGKAILNKITANNKKKPFEGNDKVARNEIENNLATITGIFAPIIAAVTAKKANEEYNLSGNIAKMLRPDPSMPTKKQNDEDMSLMKMLMSLETQLKYLKNTGQGYPADEEMFLNSERENTNDMLLRLLREQNIEE